MGVHPFVGTRLSLILGQTVAFLQFANELISFSGDRIQIVVGQFTPQPYRPEWLDPGVSDEELSRREAEGGGRPLADILRDLAAMP